MNALTPYQQAVLTELGIVQWQLRAPQMLAMVPERPHSDGAVNDADDARGHSMHGQGASAEAGTESVAQPVTPDAEKVITAPADAPAPDMVENHPLLDDIRLALEALEQPADVLWQVQENVTFDGKVLTAPAPQTLCYQPELKKQLWQVLQHRR